MKLYITTDLIGGDKNVRAGDVTERFAGADAVRLIQAGYARLALPDQPVTAPVEDASGVAEMAADPDPQSGAAPRPTGRSLPTSTRK